MFNPRQAKVRKADTPKRLANRADYWRLKALGYINGKRNYNTYYKYAVKKRGEQHKTPKGRLLKNKAQAKYESRMRFMYGPGNIAELLVKQAIARGDKPAQERKLEAQNAHRLLLQQKVQKANRLRAKASATKAKGRH